MGTLFHHPSSIQDVDPVRMLNRTETMCDGNSRASMSGAVDCYLHRKLRFRV